MSKNKKGEDLHQAAWDFSKCPADETAFCAAYEYFRQIAMVHRKRLGTKWSVRAFEYLFDGYFKDGQRREFEGIKHGTADPFEVNLAIKKLFALAACGCSGFPDTPYLSLDSNERKKWIKTFDLDQLRPDRATMAQKEFFEISVDPQDCWRRYQFHIAEWVRQHLFEKTSNPGESRRYIVNFEGFNFELGVLRINWSAPNKRLVQAFQNWLEKNRPDGIKPVEARGATQLSETLKYLSAMRLLTVITAAKATVLTEKILGKPLYWTEDNWYEARKKANAVMQQISSPFFDWA